MPDALAKRPRAHVHELDLVRVFEHLIGQPLVDRRPDDRLHRVRHRLQVLDVAGADDVDARVAD